MLMKKEKSWKYKNDSIFTFEEILVRNDTETNQEETEKILYLHYFRKETNIAHNLKEPDLLLSESPKHENLLKIVRYFLLFATVSDWIKALKNLFVYWKLWVNSWKLLNMSWNARAMADKVLGDRYFIDYCTEQ